MTPKKPKNVSIENGHVCTCFPPKQQHTPARSAHQTCTPYKSTHKSCLQKTRDMIPIPDHPIGERFCRKCKLFLPLKDFFKGKKRRYECKVHSRGRPRKAPSKKQKLPSSEQASKTSPQQKAVAQVWHAAYTDCRSSFGQATVGMSQGELRDLFEALGAEASTAFRLVPIDPCKELTPGNARLVRREVRIRALRSWSDAQKRHSGKEEGVGSDANIRDAYMAAMQEDDVAAAAPAAAAAAADGVVEGPGQPGGLVRAEEEQRGEVGDDEREEQVEEEEGTGEEGDDNDDDDTIRL